MDIEEPLSGGRGFVVAEDPEGNSEVDMAGRGGVGTGMGVTVGLLGATSLGLFVYTLVLIGGKQTAEQNLKKLSDETREIVRESERNSADVRALIAEAGKAQKSLAGYLREQNGKLAGMITGNAGDTPDRMSKAIENALGKDGGALLTKLSATQAELATAQKTAATADAARTSAEAKLAESDARVKAMEESVKKALAGVGAEVNGIKTQTEGYRTNVNSTIDSMRGDVETIRRENNAEKVELNTRLGTLEQENQILQAKLKDLQAKGRDQLRPTDEFALVDGRVIALDPSDSKLVFIDRGSKHRVTLGMTFEVYTDARDVVADPETGEYRSGKAALEIIKIEPEQSVARVVRPRNRTVVGKGDVIVNAVYDPKKVYSFLVVGNFDTQGFGSATPEGAQDIKALVGAWGGKTVDDFKGDVDFVVLGSRPVIPPAPPPDAPVEVVTEYLRKSREARQYDEIFKQASATAIPVLNQNRLFTLIGR
ncbi:MAG: hypothetical protein IBJ18_08150 [Phycisphaerales bacterium]|nr:hypothetical protein [Phycisphaerales bacterium]